MRKFTRIPLPPRYQRNLARFQTRVNVGQSATKLWESARRTRTMSQVHDTLERMTGDRSRCMFCEDSRGTDIEHFWPKSRFPEKTFLWGNLLLACTGCNRKKGKKFDVDPAGRPLLIDPTAEDPWDFLYFDSETGMITARFGTDGNANPKGDYTTSQDVLPLNVEAITEARCRTRRNLIRAVDRFSEHLSSGMGEEDAARELADAVEDIDAYGLATWCFCRDGRNDRPFCHLEEKHPKALAKVQSTLLQRP